MLVLGGRFGLQPEGNIKSKKGKKCLTKKSCVERKFYKEDSDCCVESEFKER